MKNTIQLLSDRSRKPRFVRAFTLIEVIITLTILALIFTSVMSVFLYYSSLGAKVEANRLLQSNIKVIVEHITQDIKDNEINFEAGNHDVASGKMYDVVDDILYVGENKYYLATEVGNTWIKVDSSDFSTTCGEVQKNCSFVKNTSSEVIPLSNSWVSFRNLYFYVSKDYIPKVTMNFDMNIAYGKGIKTGIIEASTIKIQATMSEKLLDKNN